MSDDKPKQLIAKQIALWEECQALAEQNGMRLIAYPYSMPNNRQFKVVWDRGEHSTESVETMLAFLRGYSDAKPSKSE